MRWLGRDLRYAVRSLLRDRASVLPAVLALSLGIGAATVIFSVVYSVLVNAFPFEDPSRVVHFYVEGPGGGRGAYYSAPEFADYRAQNEVFSSVLGGRSMEVLYSLDNQTYRVRGTLIDTGALGALGVKPRLGRAPATVDGTSGATPSFLMSDRLWHERFNADPRLLGTRLELNGVARTLIGIMPPRFLLQAADVFFPTTFAADSTSALVGGSADEPLDIWTYARLKPGVSPEEAAANVEVIARREAARYPERYPKQFKVRVISLMDAYTGANIKQMIYILSGAVLLLLMIACCNVANLLLARASARETELAVRAGLGASRARLVQQPLAESFVLAAGGTMLGSGLALAGLQWVKVAIPADALPAEMAIHFSAEALVATVLVTMVTTIACGLVPALRAARGDLQGRLTNTGKGVGLRTGSGRLRRLLVTVQVTLAIVLLAGAGLMMRTLFALQRIDPGVNPQNVLVGRFGFPANVARTPQQVTAFTQQVVDKLATLPGVVAVSPSWALPLEGTSGSSIAIPGVAFTARPVTRLDFVGDGYFRALGIPLVLGRPFSPADIVGARRVCIVNRRFVETFFGDIDALGRMVSFSGAGGARPGGPPAATSEKTDERPLFEIVGIAGDMLSDGLESTLNPEAFLPYTTPGVRATSLSVRTSGDPLKMQESVRRTIWDIDRGVAFVTPMALETLLERDAFAAPKFGVGLLSAFGAIGLILSAVGVFSVMAYSVSLQTHEIGIRMALGAQPSGVMRMTIVRGLRPVAAGIVFGIAASYAATRVLSAHVYGVTTTDPWTFSVTVIVLAVVSVFACVIPARRAMRVDPIIALRQE